jgi:hypothetical protein
LWRTMNNRAKLGLCGPGRHEIPEVSGYVFPAEINPLDVQGLEAHAAKELEGITALDLYVTGLSVALVAVINAAIRRGVDLTLWHYDRDSGQYYPQRVEAGK